jgi:4-hydroxy-2-oxoglutarate aldolase
LFGLQLQSIHEHLLGTTTWHSKRVASDLGISALKYALDWNGYYGGPARLPLLPLTAELKAEVEQLMVDLRN